MKIKVTKHHGRIWDDGEKQDYFRADCLDFSGTPPVGMGLNKYEAIGSLIYVLTKSTTSGPDDRRWTEKFLKENFEIIEE